MTRRLLKVLKVVSIVLLGASVVLLVASKFCQIELTLRESPASVVTAGVHRGGVYVLTVSAPHPGWRGAAHRILDDWILSLAGFKVGPELPPNYWPGSPNFVVVPIWFLLTVFGASAVVCWWLGGRRGHASGPGGFAVRGAVVQGGGG